MRIGVRGYLCSFVGRQPLRDPNLRFLLSLLGGSACFLVPGAIALTAVPTWLDGRQLRRAMVGALQTDCVLTRASVQRETFCGGTVGCFRPALSCVYEVAGRRYEVDSRYAGFAMSRRYDAEQRAAQLQSQPHQVFYAPRQPSRAAFSRVLDLRRFAIRSLFGLAFVGFVSAVWLVLAGAWVLSKIGRISH